MIRLMIPDMPTADELLPWLRRIDTARIYTNGGPLLRQLEDELSSRGSWPTAVVSNGTLAIELALRALRLPPGAPVLTPAVSFVATGRAIVNAGLRPVFIDVDPKTWQLTAEIAAKAIDRVRPRAIVPVATFGMPVDPRAWENLARASGIPVVVDAAGALLESARMNDTRITSASSLHATKFVGAGEGGVVSSVDGGIVRRVRDLAAFGDGGTNAKLSEYHAAVALASLERMSAKAARMVPIVRGYCYGLQGLPVKMQRVPNGFSTLLVVKLPAHIQAADAVDGLRAVGVEAKQWYRPYPDEVIGGGPFDSQQLLDMPVTKALRHHALGLPFHAWLTEADVATVCRALARIINLIAETHA